MKRSSIFLALAIFAVLPGNTFASVSATGSPSWYFTVPKPDAIEPRSFMLGLPYLEYSPAERLEIGLHGVKYAFEGSNSYPLAVGVDPILGFAYAYAVWGLPTNDGNDLTVGVKIFPLFLLLGFETQIDERVSFLVEANDGVMAGLRVRIDPYWHVEFGAGIAAYGVWRADRRGIHDYEFEDIDFEPTIWVGFAYSDFIRKYSR